MPRMDRNDHDPQRSSHRSPPDWLRNGTQLNHNRAGSAARLPGQKLMLPQKLVLWSKFQLSFQHVPKLSMLYPHKSSIHVAEFLFLTLPTLARTTAIKTTDPCTESNPACTSSETAKSRRGILPRQTKHKESYAMRSSVHWEWTTVWLNPVFWMTKKANSNHGLVVDDSSQESSLLWSRVMGQRHL